MSNVFIAFQANEESRPVVEAIVADNPTAVVTHPTGLTKIDVPQRLTIRRETIEEITGRPYDLQQIHHHTMRKPQQSRPRNTFSAPHKPRCSRSNNQSTGSYSRHQQPQQTPQRNKSLHNANCRRQTQQPHLPTSTLHIQPQLRQE